MRLMIRKSLYDEIMKSLSNNSRLQYFKNELCKIVDKQAEKENSVSKAIEQYDFIHKSMFGIGTVREWKGKKYRKIAAGKWRRIYTSNERGINTSIENVKRSINNAKNFKELGEIVSQNIRRFYGDDGKLLPIAQQILSEAKNRRDIVLKNSKGQFIYDDYKKLTDKQKEYVINDLLSREYEEIGDGIFAETERKVKLGDKTFEKEFMDCKILRQIGFEKLFMLPQQYCVRTNGQTGNNTDTFAFKDGEKFDFIELKNLDESNIESLQRNYTKSLKQARNVFIQYDKYITDDDFVLAIHNRINGLKNNPKTKDIAKVGFKGNVFLYKSKENEVLQLKVNKNGLEDTSSPGEPSSQRLLKTGVMVKFRLSNNFISS